MHSRHQNGGHKGAESSLGISRIGLHRIRARNPHKIHERDWIEGGPSTGLEESGKRLDSLKDSLLIPKTQKIYGGLARILGQLLLEPAHSLHPQECIIFHPNKYCHYI